MTVHLSFYEEGSEEELAAFTDAPIPKEGEEIEIEVQVTGDQWIEGLTVELKEYTVISVEKRYQKLYRDSVKENVYASVTVR